MPLKQIRSALNARLKPQNTPYEPERNHAHGGRSFYFFDFDDNIAFLTTAFYVFHKVTGEIRTLTTGDFVEHGAQIGISGPFKDYQISLDPENGSFRDFHDQDHSLVERWLLGRKQKFVTDLGIALGLPDLHWQGPSWACFVHATRNHRPLSLITARGHSPQTITHGIEMFIRRGHLPHRPNFLSIYPVSHEPTRRELGDIDLTLTVPELKQRAIRASVQQALEIYGHGPHQFGMSDDCPRNIVQIEQEMTTLKAEFPQMSFFVFETYQGHFRRREISSCFAG